MKTKAIQTQEVDVEIDPLRVLIDIERKWICSLQLPEDSYIDNGIWYYTEHVSYWENEIQIRKATQHEIAYYKSFIDVAEAIKTMKQEEVGYE